MGKLINKFFASVMGATLLILSLATVPAQANHIYEGDSFLGGWALSDRRQGDMIVGDGNGSGLSLGSTERFCGRQGASYSKMRSYINSNYSNGGLSWYVDEICNDGYVRICVYSASGNQACSTFEDWGWVRLD
jgi:hypothetical protein